jgi:hypothetical protein
MANGANQMVRAVTYPHGGEKGAGFKIRISFSRFAFRVCKERAALVLALKNLMPGKLISSVCR